MNNISLRTIFLLLVLFCGCNSESYKLANFYKRVTSEVTDPEYLANVKRMPQDSLYTLSPGFDLKYKDKLLADSATKLLWLEINKDRFDRFSYIFRDDILLRSLNKHLNHERIDLDEIKRQAINAQDQRDQEFHRWEADMDKELLSVIDFNDKTCNVGDTLNLFFQLRGGPMQYGITYKLYPYTLRFHNADDTLRLTGILKEKFYRKEKLAPDELANLFFRVKVLRMNKKSVANWDKMLKIGDDFKFEVGSYGMLIGRPFEHPN